MVFLISGSGYLVTPTGSFIRSGAVPELPDFELNSYKPGTNTDNIVLQLGAGGTWDDNRILHPNAVSQGGTVYLFYSGHDGSTYKIGVATEAEAGFTGLGFAKYGSNPILSPGAGGTWDAVGVFGPWVIYDSDASLWKMWYSGIDASNNFKIGYATASDPLGPWTKHGSNPVLSPAGWEGSIVSWMSVLRENATTYKMMYAGNEPASANGRIGLATSSDGVSWTKYGSNPVLSPAGAGWMAASVFSPRTLVKSGSTYHLYFSAKPSAAGGSLSKSGYAHSSDLISWTVPGTNPLLSADRTWEGQVSPPGEIENPNAILVGTNWYIFYDCWFGSPSTIGVAIVPI